MSLIDFLRAQLDKDERAARAATPGPWRHDPKKHWHKPGTAIFEEAVFAGPPGRDAVCVAGTGASDDQQSMADAAHIARHDPARVHREVRAKRKLLELHLPESSGLTPEPFCACQDDDGVVSGEWPCETLRILALPYSDHKDYRPEWKPGRSS